jgi:hypothetical protein
MMDSGSKRAEMRLGLLSMWCILAVLCYTTHGLGQGSTFNGPILGFIAGDGEAVQPIIGVLGASVVGRPIVMGSDAHDAVTAPGHDYALAIAGENSAVVLVRLGSDSASVSAIEGVRPGADRIAFSPTGAAAAVYGSSGVVQSITGLPDAPRVAFEFDASGVPGRLERLAITDDGTLALLDFAAEEEAALWAFSWNGSRWLLPAQRPSAAAFLAYRHDAVVADDLAQEVFLMRNIDQESTRTPLAAFADGFDAISSLAAHRKPSASSTLNQDRSPPFRAIAARRACTP